MVPASLARIALAACSLRTSPCWWSTSWESETVLLVLLDDDDDSYASWTNLDVDTRRSVVAAVVAAGCFSRPSCTATRTGLGRVADACESGDTLDIKTGGDSGNVTNGSAPSTGLQQSTSSATAELTAVTSPPSMSIRCWSSWEFCSSDDVVVISDTCRCKTCWEVDDEDDVDDDDSIIRELEDDDDVFFFDDAFWKQIKSKHFRFCFLFFIFYRLRFFFKYHSLTYLL